MEAEKMDFRRFYIPSIEVLVDMIRDPYQNQLSDVKSFLDQDFHQLAELINSRLLLRRGDIDSYEDNYDIDEKIQTLERLLEKKDAEIKTLVEKLENVPTRLGKDALTFENERLKKEKEDLLEEIRGYRIRMAEFSRDKNMEGFKLTHIQQKMDHLDLIQQIEQLNADLQNKESVIRELMNNSNSSDSKVSELRKDLSKKAMEIETLKNQNSQSVTEFEQISSELRIKSDEYNNLLDNYNSEIGIRDKKIMIMDEKISALEKELKEKEQIIHESSVDANGDKEYYNKQILNKDKIIADLRDEIGTYKGTLKEIQDEYNKFKVSTASSNRQHQENMTSVIKDVETLKIENSKLVSDLRESSEQVQKLQKESDSNLEFIDSLRSQIEKLQADINNKENKILSLTTETDTKENTIRGLQHQQTIDINSINLLQTKLTEKEEEINKLIFANNTMQNKLSDEKHHIDQINELQSKNDDISREISRLNLEIEKKNIENMQLERMNEDLKLRNEKSEQTIMKQKDEIRIKDQEISACVTQNTVLVRENESLMNKINCLTSQESALNNSLKGKPAQETGFLSSQSEEGSLLQTEIETLKGLLKEQENQNNFIKGRLKTEIETNNERIQRLEEENKNLQAILLQQAESLSQNDGLENRANLILELHEKDEEITKLRNKLTQGAFTQIGTGSNIERKNNFDDSQLIIQPGNIPIPNQNAFSRHLKATTASPRDLLNISSAGKSGAVADQNNNELSCNQKVSTTITPVGMTDLKVPNVTFDTNYEETPTPGKTDLQLQEIQKRIRELETDTFNESNDLRVIIDELEHVINSRENEFNKNREIMIQLGKVLSQIRLLANHYVYVGPLREYNPDIEKSKLIAYLHKRDQMIQRYQLQFIELSVQVDKLIKQKKSEIREKYKFDVEQLQEKLDKFQDQMSSEYKKLIDRIITSLGPYIESRRMSDRTYENACVVIENTVNELRKCSVMKKKYSDAKQILVVIKKLTKLSNPQECFDGLKRIFE